MVWARPPEWRWPKGMLTKTMDFIAILLVVVFAAFALAPSVLLSRALKRSRPSRAEEPTGGDGQDGSSSPADRG
jgi:hypothetical protein